LRGFIRDAYVKKLRGADRKSSATTTWPSRSPIPIRNRLPPAGPTRSLTAHPHLRQRLRRLRAPCSIALRARAQLEILARRLRTNPILPHGVWNALSSRADERPIRPVPIPATLGRIAEAPR